MDFYEIITEIDHIGKAIFGLLSNEELCDVRLVCKTWKDFVGNAKFWKCRILKKFQKNDSDIVGRILKRNKFIEIEKLTEIVLESRKTNPYLYSIENEKLSFVQFLWNFVEDKNPLVRRDLSVFHLSAEKGRRIIVRHFLQHFCDKNPSNFDGNTPLHFAAKNGHTDIVQDFMDRSHQDPSMIVNCKNQSGFTPLHYASENGHFSIVQCLLRYTMDKNPKNEWGTTPLHYAAVEGHLKIVELLSEMLPNICPKDHLGDTPLHLAARSGHLSIVKYFMGRVEEKHPKNSFGYTPLHKASRKGHLQVVGYLSDNFIPNDDMRNVWGETPLSYLP